jgi:hypothetical protein
MRYKSTGMVICDALKDAILIRIISITFLWADGVESAIFRLTAAAMMRQKC